MNGIIAELIGRSKDGRQRFIFIEEHSQWRWRCTSVAGFDAPIPEVGIRIRLLGNSAYRSAGENLFYFGGIVPID
jgi:hypothetical protein